MTVDATIPTSSTLGADLPSILRETRSEVNLLWSAIAAVGGGATYQTIAISAGATEIELSGAGLLHTLVASASVAVDIEQLTGGTEGQYVVVKAVTSNITLKYDATKLDLGGDQDYLMTAKDFIILLNEGGDPDSSVDGIWIEVMRSYRA